MQLTIIKKDKLIITVLPEKVSGSHWVTDYENGKKINLLNIESENNIWKLISNDDAFIVGNNDVMIPYVELKNNMFYIIKNNYKNEKYYLYCSPVYDQTYKEFPINNLKSVSVGSGKSCEITYNLNALQNKEFEIIKDEKYYYINIFRNDASIYVNGKRIFNKKRIEYGDVIFIFGLKIILLRRDSNDYLLVNNPNNLLEFKATFTNVVTVKSSFVEDYQSLNDDALMNEKNYFYRTPYFYEELNKYVLQIDNPPQKKEEDKTPAALTIGPMVTMSMTSMVTLISTVGNIGSGKTTAGASVTSLVMGGAMLASSLLWPILTRTYQKISDKKYEDKRQKQYSKYLDNKEKEIEKELEKQRNSLIKNNFSVTDCQNVIRGHNIKLWQRRLNDKDFLTLPVGIGNMKMQIEIKYPEEHFSLYEDNMLDKVYDLGRKERILKDVPVTFSFYENIATGIVGNPIINKDFIDRLMLQIMANYSYDEVKIVTFTNADNENDWNYMKVLPHCWSNDKALRYFGSSNDDYREIIYSLEKIYNERKKMTGEDLKYIPHYVIVTDAIKSIESYDFIKNIMSSKVNYGFSIIMLVDKLSALPNECKSFIELNKEECSIFNSVLNTSNQKFKIDYAPIEEIYNCASILSNIPIDIKTDVETKLPDVYHFLEMYQVGRVDQLNVSERWKKSNPMLSLQAPVGIGKSGEIINLDLHEKYHGPHGLIAGTTGSGKSEFIITYILSLAINYHPNEVQIILIDYKGGSLAGSFSNDMYELPHLAGTITNLDGNELNRSLASIESEIKRRQREFNDAKNIANESTMNIYKYQKLWRQGKLKGKEPIAHLFIISDEFAELKEQQPEFMEKLISAARVGRSLGIHLILATQKPGGVVDPQIWSNTRFRVCLKVQDTSDSQEVLKKPDAAYLKKTGRFYLQVGTDEVFTLGQSSWAGGQYYPSNTFKKDIDVSVNAINNIGFITTSKECELKEEIMSLGEELPNIVKYISNVAKEENVLIKKLWLQKIPENIYIDNLKNKYNYLKKDYYLNPVIGEYDDPENQEQNLLTVPFSKLGNAIIYGIAGSGKEDFLSSLTYSLISNYTEEEVNIYIMDFGSETLRIFNKVPHVGDIIYVSDNDKVNNLFKLINKWIKTRKELFASFGGDYNHYIDNQDKRLPNIVIIINNYESFIENYEDINEELTKITREAYKYGIYFVITATSDNSVRLKMKQNVSMTYALQQNNDSDYSSILGNVRGKIPAKIKGRGLFKIDSIYEFQTAKIHEEENKYLKEFINNMNSNYKAMNIPVLPDIVDYNFIKNNLDKSNPIIGINKNSLSLEKYNFNKNPITCISSLEIENTYNYINALINEIIYLDNYDLCLFDSSELDFNNELLNNKIFKKNYDDILNKYFDYVDKLYEEYINNNYDDNIIKNEKKHMIIVYGVYDFINKLKIETKNRLSEIIKKIKDINVLTFVLVDNAEVLKSFAYDDWFKNGNDSGKGIWIGSGVGDQSLFKISRLDRDDREEIPNDYGYLISNAKLYRIKLLNSFNAK